MRLRKLSAVGPALALVMATGACDQGLTDINQNPNEPAAVDPQYLLANAMTRAVGGDFGTHSSWFGLYLTNIWPQQVAQVKYNDEDLYFLRSGVIESVWNNFYAGSLEDLLQVKTYANEQKDVNLAAVSDIFSQWNFQVVTDTWGDVPYSDALRLDRTGQTQGENLFPKYDAQKDIYYGMLARLTDAGKAINTGASTAGFSGGDLLYHGDMSRWRKFSNSLRLRMAMRISNVDPTKARTEALAALAAPGGVFTSNADNAMLVWTNALRSQNPVYDYFYNQDRYDNVISAAMVDTLSSLKDPRLAVYADPAASDGKYRGLQNGTLPADYDLNVSDFSSIGKFFLAPDAPSYIMTYAEVLFLQAEAANRGLITGNAKQLYEAGIRAAMQQYRAGGAALISDAAIDAYLARPAVQYKGGAAGLQQIYLQKWIALYMNGPEAYAEVRRTGFPELEPADGDQIPNRVTYPNQEQTLNGTNLQTAVKRNGGLSLHDKMWWQK